MSAKKKNMPTSHTMELPRQIVVGEKNIDRVGKFLESLSKPKKVSIVSGKNVKKIIGKKSFEIEEILGFLISDVVVHRDNMILKDKK